MNNNPSKNPRELTPEEIRRRKLAKKRRLEKERRKKRLRVIFTFLSILIIAAIIFTSVLKSRLNNDYDTSLNEMSGQSEAVPLRNILNPDSEIRGVWIASVYNIDYPTKTDLSAEQLKAELDSILETCEKNNLNTIFFQVRPSCDALYQSKIFPISEFISSNGVLEFDPLDYLIREAHQRNIYVHAWINPLRVTMNSHDIETLDDKSPAKQHPEWTVPYADGKLYLNAGIPEVASLVVEGVREIVEGYDVDGVVFDDYFYPYPVYGDDGNLAEFDDTDEYEKYGDGYSSIAEWRRDNINKMIEAVYHAVHEADSECIFGVSPFAIWQNNNGENDGSDTKGFEAYNSLYCDALAWIEGGYIDYISPQIYWQFSNSETAFDTVTRWWNTKLEGSDVKLYVSHASYQYEDGGWDSPEGQLKEQISYARSEKYYYGSIFYGYDEIKRNIHGASDELIEAYENEIIYTEIQSNLQPIRISSPADGSTLTTENTYIMGSSDPYYTLTVNGETVGKTKSGLFNLYVTLKKGANIFTFEENGEIVEYTIYYNPTPNTSQKDDAVPYLDHITIVNTYPASDVITKAEELTVSCTAPYNSVVTAALGENSVTLTPEKTAKFTDSGYYTAVNYSGVLSLPKCSDNESIELGAVKFFLSHSHGSTEAEGAEVTVLGKNAFVTIRAEDNYTSLKITESSSYYNDYTVQSAGMTELAEALSNGFYKLRMGGYISSNDVSVIENDGYFLDKLSEISSADVKNCGDTTDFTLKTTQNVPYNAAIDENSKFVVTLYSTDAESAPDVIIEKNPIVKSCEVIRLENKVRYSFELYAVENFYGFDLRYSDGNTIVSLRNPMSVDINSENPLSGINIVLDAGHGGADRGAAGVISSGELAKNEKDLNLEITLSAAEKLESLGANVILTRTDDSSVELMDRVRILEELEPDLSVSIHQNSIDYAYDITKIRGTLGLWCMDSGVLLSRCIAEEAASSLGRSFSSRYQMLAMCRNPKFPQALIELGFITSVEEYEQLLTPRGIELASEGIVKGVLKFFEKQSEYARL